MRDGRRNLATTKRHQSAPSCPSKVPGRLPPMPDHYDQLLYNLFTYITTPYREACQHVLRFGGGALLWNDVPQEDGHKYVCVDRSFHISNPKLPCLIYSFGVSTDWSFDWDMESFGCEVFSFDPSINTTTGSQNGTIMFLQYGIGPGDVDLEGGWRLKTLDSFMNWLGHKDRRLDYLKLDVEGNEWLVLSTQVSAGLKSPLAKNVDQLGVELHFGDHLPLVDHVLFYIDVYQTFLRMEQLGFVLFSYEPNPTVTPNITVPGLDIKLPHAVEVVWLKTKC